MKQSEHKPAVFIDERVAIHEGAEAEAMLRNLRKHLRVDAQCGITEVDECRWKEAQRYEKRTWMDLGQALSSDRNEDHCERFRNYDSLRGRSFRRGIELGCGPFTNMRLVLQACSVDEVHLLDPLIESYLKHPGCQYKNQRLGGLVNSLLGGGAPKTCYHLLESYRIGGWLGKPVRIEVCAIEEFPVSDLFDLVVMVNVIEHCRSVHVVFNKILKMLEPGGVFVFHDRMYNAHQLEELSNSLYDAGHPLRVDQTVFRDFLVNNFDVVMSQEAEVARSYKGIRWNETELYYIGVKK